MNICVIEFSTFNVNKQTSGAQRIKMAVFHCVSSEAHCVDTFCLFILLKIIYGYSISSVKVKGIIFAHVYFKSGNDKIVSMKNE